MHIAYTCHIFFVGTCRYGSLNLFKFPAKLDVCNLLLSALNNCIWQKIEINKNSKFLRTKKNINKNCQNMKQAHKTSHIHRTCNEQFNTKTF